MIAGINPIPSTNSEGNSLTSGASLGKNDFLKLLVAQLEHQDPLAPQEGQEFAAQLAQFSSLEQLTNINDNLEASQAFDLALSNSSMVNLIGKTVDAPGNKFELGKGESETLSFSIGEDASEVSIDIFNSAGANVASLSLVLKVQVKKNLYGPAQIPAVHLYQPEHIASAFQQKMLLVTLLKQELFPQA